MSNFVALLRAVNVGGTGKLLMSELVSMCESAGFQAVRTYIASGNVIFKSRLSERSVKSALEGRLAAYAGKPIGVVVRTADEMKAVLASNPFKDVDASRTVAIFLDHSPPADALDGIKGKANERIALGSREIYVAYVDGIGRSKLMIPAAKNGTARNMNTIAKLAQMAAVL